MSGLSRRVGAALVLVAGLSPLLAGPASASVTRVAMTGTKFAPAKVQIELGDTVIWEAGDDGHTVTARDGSFDSSSRGLMAEGDQYRWRFKTAGTYAYFCRVHGNRGMQGEVVVVDPAAPTTTSTRLTPVTAAAPTSTTASPLTTVPTEPATTTSRVLSTSSSTSPAIATTTTALVGTPVAPQEPPPMNPAAPVLGTAEADAKLPGAQAAAQRTAADDETLAVITIVVVAGLAVFGGVMGFRARRRRSA